MRGGALVVLKRRVLSVCALLILLLAVLAGSAGCSCRGGDTSTTVSTEVAEVTSTAIVVFTTTEAPVTEETSSTTSSTLAITTTTSSVVPVTTTTLVTVPSIETQISVQPMPLQWTRIEENHSSLHYSGTWMGVLETEASGPGYRETNQLGAKAEITFQGTRIRLISMTGPEMGRAKLMLDGSGPVYAELYDPEGGSKTVWTSGVLTDEPHTLVIEWSGVKNPASTNTVISIEAIELIGVVAI